MYHFAYVLDGIGTTSTGSISTIEGLAIYVGSFILFGMVDCGYAMLSK